jgi:hypothetical protein
MHNLIDLLDAAVYLTPVILAAGSLFFLTRHAFTRHAFR